MKTLSDRSGDGFSRRRFLARSSVLGAGSFLGLPRTAAAETPPGIQKIRLVKVPAICLAPEYLAEELLRLEAEALESLHRRRHSSPSVEVGAV